MNILVGHTGFVGSNLYQYGRFHKGYNSKNIGEAYGSQPELLVYAGLRAEKYLANTYPEKDAELIRQAQENIMQIRPQKLVFISSIDVLSNNEHANEDVWIDTDALEPYGYNRYMMEKWVRNAYPDAVIIRLPALFGQNIKKNFIYDYLKKIPYMIKKEKMQELTRQCADLPSYYELQENGFYRCKRLQKNERVYLNGVLENIKFTALNFIDSRSRYQYYPLRRLWTDIEILLQNNITLWHPATEPVSAGELFYYLECKEFRNEIMDVPANYCFTTKYDSVFGGKNGYICDKGQILKEIKQFIKEYQAVED